MNEHFTPLRQLRRIDLAIEGPRALGCLTIRPASLEIEGPDEVLTLEPRCMQVLVALISARGQPVSRDELMELCWDGRIVTEGALNRCVAQVRKALAAEPRAQIDTIAKIGYRLRLLAPGARTPAAPAGPAPTPEEPPIPAAEPNSPASARRPAWTPALVAGVAILAGGVGLVWGLTARPASWTAEAVRPLTAEPGAENHPALSRDGRLLVYAAGPESRLARDLYLRGMDGGAPVRLTRDPADDAAPAWAPGQDKIAFVRRGGGPCEIRVMAIPSGAERAAGRCSTATTTRLSWLDDRTVLFSDQPVAGQVRRIRALDVETGAVRDLTAPPPSSHGDSDPAVSPDGARLLFRRTNAHGIDDLYVRPVRARAGTERPLTQDGWKAHGSAWAADSRHVFFTSNRGGDFGLWTVDASGGRPAQRVSLGVANGFSRISADGQNHLAVEVFKSRSNLAWLRPDGTAEPLTSSNASDWDPDVAPDGAVTFVSTPSGSPEVWVRTPGAAAAQRLTGLTTSYVHRPRWSPDGRTIAFVAVHERNAQVFLIGREGGELRRLTDEPGDKHDPVFADGGRALIYLQRQAEGWRPVRLALTPGAKPQLLANLGVGWRSLRDDGQGRLYGVKNGDRRVWTIDPAAGRATPLTGGPAVAPEDVWLPRPEGVYLARAKPPQGAELFLAPWRGPERRVGDLPTLEGAPSLAVDPRNGRVLFSQTLESQADLALIGLARS